MRVDMDKIKQMCAGILDGSVTHVVANNTFRAMTEDTVYPILSYSIAKNNIACNDGDILIEIEHGTFHHSNFYAYKNVVKIRPISLLQTLPINIPIGENIQIKLMGLI